DAKRIEDGIFLERIRLRQRSGHDHAGRRAPLERRAREEGPAREQARRPVDAKWLSSQFYADGDREMNPTVWVTRTEDLHRRADREAELTECQRGIHQRVLRAEVHVVHAGRRSALETSAIER